MVEILNQDPESAAQALVGKKLKVGHKTATITKVLPQTSRDNSHWLQKPLFGPNPVDAYVSPYRGYHLLFLRTGGNNTCVRIEAVTMKDEKVKRPGLVTDALGIYSERTGNVTEDADGAIRITWHRR